MRTGIGRLMFGCFAASCSFLVGCELSAVNREHIKSWEDVAWVDSTRFFAWLTEYDLVGARSDAWSQAEHENVVLDLYEYSVAEGVARRVVTLERDISTDLPVLGLYHEPYLVYSYPQGQGSPRVIRWRNMNTGAVGTIGQSTAFVPTVFGSKGRQVACRLDYLRDCIYTFATAALDTLPAGIRVVFIDDSTGTIFCRPDPNYDTSRAILTFDPSSRDTALVGIWDSWVYQPIDYGRALLVRGESTGYYLASDLGVAPTFHPLPGIGYVVGSIDIDLASGAYVRCMSAGIYLGTAYTSSAERLVLQSISPGD